MGFLLLPSQGSTRLILDGAELSLQAPSLSMCHYLLCVAPDRRRVSLGQVLRKRQHSKKSLYVCPLQLAENPNGFSSKALKMSTKYLLVTIIFSSLHWDGWREFSPVVKSPKGGGVYQRVQLTLWQIILKFGIVHSLGSYCEYWQSWKQSTNCQTMVAEVIAWVFNMITVLVLLTPCLALSNLSWSCDNWLCIW